MHIAVKVLRFLFYTLLCGVLVSCHEQVPNTNRSVSLAYYQELANPAYTLNSKMIRAQIDSLIRNDKGTTVADLHTKRYYRNQGNLLWITRYGVDHRADTLLSYLCRVGEMGFRTAPFHVKQLHKDLERIRTLDLQEAGSDANHVMARLEYRLTRAYLRYTIGQRFGFTNPTYLLNRLDSIVPNPYDTIQRPTRYRGLFDVNMEHPDARFYRNALQSIRANRVNDFLSEVQPQSDFYSLLARRLQNPNISRAMRAKVLCNMERCRWRQADLPNKHKKYVMVNIPSYHLLAIDHADTLSMRIGCGTTKTKTPILNSYIKNMELNPQWFVPRSIMIHDMVRHAGNAHYFTSHNYYIVDRSTKEEINPTKVSQSMLLSGRYNVVQRGGKGNALGRIIFRFENNFSVFLHDTSSRDFFGREDRGVSHGCVRVEKPFELARFLLADKDGQLLEKIQYSMTADSLADRRMTIGQVKVTPQIPLFIGYYTLYPMAGGRIVEYPDVYGYDAVIYQQLEKYL